MNLLLKKILEDQVLLMDSLATSLKNGNQLEYQQGNKLEEKARETEKIIQENFWKEKNNMQESKYHECETINKAKNISIEKINGYWTWVFWSDKKGNQGHGIGYCPYCGAKLD